MIAPPLVVDLDGTLIFTDTLHESAIRVFKKTPLAVLAIPLWLIKGKASLKQVLASRTKFDPAILPYNSDLLTWLKNQRANGRRLVLCTAADVAIATAVADHLGIFDDIMASDGVVNLEGRSKANALASRYGKAGFDYVGNSTADLEVWRVARRGVVVNARHGIVEKAKEICNVEKMFPSRSIGWAGWRRVLRLHQWLKNFLLFVPICAAHQIGIGEAWLLLLLAFLSFSLCASSVYIANDLLDLESDRQHPRKQNRPFASGLVPAWKGVLLAPSILIASVGLGTFVGGDFLHWLLAYFAVTCAYSWWLKRVILIDCLTLAILYTVRIVAGAAAIGMDLSFWLLAFSVFLFLSLAFVKRYAELELQVLNGKETIHGRAYHTTDAPLIQTMGVTAGYASVLVLALYLNSDSVVELYRSPEVVWGAVPVMLFWISRMWMQAHRGKMDDDPLVFAMKDKASQIAGLCFAGIVIIGATGLPW